MGLYRSCLGSHGFSLPERPENPNRIGIKKTLEDEKGLLTIDFIFAFIIIFGFVGILFSFAMTFSVVELVQYVSFASARNYSLAHLDENRQRERSDQKFDELTGSQALSALLSNGWFKVEKSGEYRFNDIYKPDGSMDSDIFEGVRISFRAPILFKRVPLLGTTASDPDGFHVNIQSFLAREPTFEECKTFVSERADVLKRLGYNFNSRQARLMMDNGC